MSVQVVAQNKLTVQSATEADLQPGNVVFDERGTKYIKCKAGAAIASNEAVQINTTAATTERGYAVPNVIKVANIVSGDKLVGFNNTGASITSGNFFWAKKGPVVTALGGTTGNLTAGALLYASATAGELDDAAGTATVPVGVAMTGRTGTGTFTALISYPG